MAWEFGNSLNWDRVLTNTYTARPASPTDPDLFISIPRLTVLVDSTVLLVGMRNRFAKPRWYLAGGVSPRLLFSPSSRTEFTSTVVSQGRVRIGLDRLTLLRFRDFNVSPYLLEIDIAAWHREMYVEVWKYSGPLDDVDTHLQRIETKLDTALNQ